MSTNGKTPAFKNPVIRWIDHRLPMFSYLDHELNDYPTPRNLNYMWSFGSLAGFMLVAMIVTGIVLAMHYTPESTMAFNSVEHIMRDVNYGWLIRYLHMNGASMFFIVVYLHIFRGLYYGSYKAPRELLWLMGIDMKGPQDSIPFHPYYTVKDFFGLAVFLIFYASLVFFAPNLFGEPDNYIPANPLATPPEIVPEWYFLPY